MNLSHSFFQNLRVLVVEYSTSQFHSGEGAGFHSEAIPTPILGLDVARLLKVAGYSPTLVCRAEEYEAALKVLSTSEVYCLDEIVPSSEDYTPLSLSLLIQSAIQDKNPNLIFVIGGKAFYREIQDYFLVRDEQTIVSLPEFLPSADFQSSLSELVEQGMSNFLAQQEALLFARMGVMNSFNSYDYLLPQTDDRKES